MCRDRESRARRARKGGARCAEEVKGLLQGFLFLPGFISLAFAHMPRKGRFAGEEASSFRTGCLAARANKVGGYVVVIDGCVCGY